MPNTLTPSSFRESARLVALLCCAAVLATGCGPSSGEGRADGKPPVTVPAPAPARPGATVVVCVDVSSSYDDGHRREAKRIVADALPRLVRPDHGPSTVYVYGIGVNSYGRPPLLTVSVPGLRAEPAAVLKSTKPMQGEQLAGEHLKVRERWQEDREAARELARAKARKIRLLRLPTEGGSDIGGCLENASEQFERAKGGRRLVIASDLREDGVQQRAAARLKDVDVDVIEFACDQAEECHDLATTWENRFRDLGADPVTITRPGIPVSLFTAEVGDE